VINGLNFLMEFFNSNQKEIVRIAADVLNWELPMLLTQSELDQMKVIASAAITHSHDVLNIKSSRLIIKPNVKISDLAKFNRQMNSLR
jgi:hypothetical protein